MSIDILSYLAAAIISSIHTATGLGLLVERVGVSILIFSWHAHTHMHTHTHPHTYTVVAVRMLEVSSFSWRLTSLSYSLSLSISFHSQSLCDAATSVQFNSSLIHVLRVNGNKLSKLFEPPTGLRQREVEGGGTGGCYSC